MEYYQYVLMGKTAAAVTLLLLKIKKKLVFSLLALSSILTVLSSALWEVIPGYTLQQIAMFEFSCVGLVLLFYFDLIGLKSSKE